MSVMLIPGMPRFVISFGLRYFVNENDIQNLVFENFPIDNEKLSLI